MLDNLKQEWQETDPKFRWIIIALVASAAAFLLFRMMQPAKVKPLDATASAPLLDANGNPVDPNKRRLLPQTPRNQGLEDVLLQMKVLQGEVATLKRAGTSNGTSPDAAASASALTLTSTSARAAPAAASAASAAVNLDAALPPAVNFEQPGANKRSAGADASRAGLPPGDPSGQAPAPAPSPARTMKVWAADETADTAQAELPVKVIPVNSALESVMLTGINARPTGAIAGAVGSSASANSVGAPFVTRIKGDAILPNGWKLGDLGDCFLGGSGIAILSTERAYVIADNLSCVSPSGVVYEGAIKAYGVDVDGTLGIAGKVVSKQGTLLMQAALTGMASGLGSALSPQTIPSYNTGATNGSTAAVQYPALGTVAQTAVGQGLNQAASQLSKFYLEYAKEVFPVVEVTSQTRVTWILKESVELKARAMKSEQKVARQ